MTPPPFFCELLSWSKTFSVSSLLPPRILLSFTPFYSLLFLSTFLSPVASGCWYMWWGWDGVWVGDTKG